MIHYKLVNFKSIAFIQMLNDFLQNGGKKRQNKKITFIYFANISDTSLLDEN